MARCSSCIKSKRTTGAASYLKAKLSASVPKEVRHARLAICRACTATDPAGVRLFREIKGRMYCGTPRLKKILRDETKEGCGCDLEDKADARSASCPLGLWNSA